MQQPDAEFYQSHRDNTEEWGKPVRPKTPSRRLASMISVRLSADEASEVRAAAARVGESVSNFIRNAVLRQVRGSVGEATATGLSTSTGRRRPPTWTAGGPVMSDISDGTFVTGAPRLQAVSS